MVTAWRINKDLYYELHANEADFSSSVIKAVEGGVETEYSLGSGGVERKRLYTNPDISVEMTTDTLFNESEILEYQYLVFTVTDTSNSFEVEEWCEIAPLKQRSGQFAISMPVDNELWVRKVYRSSGNVKPSAAAYALGKTTQDKSKCIIKTVECVKGVK